MMSPEYAAQDNSLLKLFQHVFDTLDDWASSLLLSQIKLIKSLFHSGQSEVAVIVHVCLLHVPSWC